MNPLYLEIVALCASGLGAVLVVYGAWSTTQSWAKHPMVLIEPLREVLSKLGRFRSDIHEEVESERGSPATGTVVISGQAAGYSRLHPISEVKDVDDLTQKVNLHLDHIYRQHGATSTRSFVKEGEFESSLQEQDRKVEEYSSEASRKIASVEGKVKQEFVSAARLQVVGSAIVVLSLFLQGIAKFLG